MENRSGDEKIGSDIKGEGFSLQWLGSILVITGLLKIRPKVGALVGKEFKGKYLKFGQGKILCHRIIILF